MNKKKLIAACFIIQLFLNAAFVYAQENSESAEIKKVMDNFLGCIPFKDLDCIMRQVSPDYSDKTGGVEVDYARFKANQAAMIERSSKKYIDISFSDVNISNLIIKDDKAALELNLTEKAYNTDTFKTETTAKRISVALEKKEGVWKVTKFRRVIISK
ncbi:hypothetical protein EPN54_05935 [bacterium]|nr:MAG: hypothetical protein EPN54_05935 [bacterium]